LCRVFSDEKWPRAEHPSPDASQAQAIDSDAAAGLANQDFRAPHGRKFTFDEAPEAYRWLDEHPQTAVKVVFAY
jgi:hypothetical protein